MSLLLFYTGPVVFVSGVVIDTLTEINVESVDLMDGETESENESPVPLEEEQHAAAIEIECLSGAENDRTVNNLYLHSNWKSVPCTTITPPPDRI